VLAGPPGLRGFRLVAGSQLLSSERSQSEDGPWFITRVCHA